MDYRIADGIVAIPLVITTGPVLNSSIQATSFDRHPIAIDACPMADLIFVGFSRSDGPSAILALSSLSRATRMFCERRPRV